MNKYDLIIFDLDGTLIDSQYDLAASVNYIRTLYGLRELSVDDVRSYIGDGIKILMERSLPDMGEAELEIATIKFRTYYGENLLRSTKLYPGVKDTLESLEGINKAVLTNKPETAARTIINKLQIDKYFIHVWGGDSGPNRKPDPQPILDIITQSKAQKDRSLMVGDGKNDILAAKAAGIMSVAVEYGYTEPENLKILQPDFTIKRISELKQIIMPNGG